MPRPDVDVDVSFPVDVVIHSHPIYPSSSPSPVPRVREKEARMLPRVHSIPEVFRLRSLVILRRPSLLADKSKATFCTEPGGRDKMEKGQTQEPKQTNKSTGDVMSNSFGEGYATRSNEEGFGGIYGGNETLGKEKNHPEEYDGTQGSEVAEKERARNQPKIH